jgi:TPR repeat protein
MPHMEIVNYYYAICVADGWYDKKLTDIQKNTKILSIHESNWKIHKFTPSLAEFVKLMWKNPFKIKIFDMLYEAVYEVKTTHPYILHQLAECYRYGIGCDKDIHRAIDLYKQNIANCSHPESHKSMQDLLKVD